MRTQVAIIGAGPAGLLLSQLLHRRGVDSIVVERRSRAEVEATVRAGVLEQGTVDVLTECGAGERLAREAFLHRGISLRFGGATHHIDIHELTGGKHVIIYPQHEVLKDLIALRLREGGRIFFEALDARIDGIDGA
ncbi:MAG: FAD-dependent monooxygenase, partial [Bacillota bacterium]